MKSPRLANREYIGSYYVDNYPRLDDTYTGFSVTIGENEIKLNVPSDNPLFSARYLAPNLKNLFNKFNEDYVEQIDEDCNQLATDLLSKVAVCRNGRKDNLRGAIHLMTDTGRLTIS